MTIRYMMIIFAGGNHPNNGSSGDSFIEIVSLEHIGIYGRIEAHKNLWKGWFNPDVCQRDTPG